MTSRLILFGYPRLERASKPVEVRLRRGLALLAWLAVEGADCSRDTLAELLWPEAAPGEGRTRLRRLLHRLRGLIGDDVLRSSVDAVGLSPSSPLEVDVVVFQAALTRWVGDRTADPRATAEVERAIALYRDDFLAGFSLPGSIVFQEWQDLVSENLRHALTHALARLVEVRAAAGDLPSALAHARRWVAVDRLQEPAHRALMKLHAAQSDTAAALRQFETCRRVLDEELGIAPQEETVALACAMRAGTPRADAADRVQPGPVRYACSGDGTYIAYRVHGSGPLDLVVMPGFVSHLDIYWDQPELAGFMRALGGMARVVTFDKRGVGLSDRVDHAPSLEQTARDLRAVLDAAGSRRIVLLGVSEGGPAAVAFASLYPERIAGLVLYGTLARFLADVDYPCGYRRDEAARRFAALIADWGGPTYIELFAPSWANDPERRAWWARALRLAASPGAARRVFDALMATDVRHLLPQVSAPTLVIHRKGDRAVGIEHGRRLAAAIAGSRLIELAGDDHWWWIGDTGPLLESIRSFLVEVGPATAARYSPKNAMR